MIKNKNKTKNRNKTKNKSLKGGFCPAKPCDNIEINIDILKETGIETFFNNLLNKFQTGILSKLSYAFNIIINQWNKNIIILSTTLERFLLLVIFIINGYTKTLNIFLDDVKLMLKLLVVILTEGGPISVLTVYFMPVMNEILSFIFDGGTLDVITSILSFDFSPIRNFVKALLYLIIGKTIKTKCNLEDYGNDKKLMDESCHSFSVPKCKINLKTLYYITLTFILLIYISSWISFFKIFYPD